MANLDRFQPPVLHEEPTAICASYGAERLAPPCFSMNIKPYLIQDGAVEIHNIFRKEKRKNDE